MIIVLVPNRRRLAMLRRWAIHLKRKAQRNAGYNEYVAACKQAENEPATQPQNPFERFFNNW